MKIAVLASGGVDSSVALRLLQEQGHEVTAYYLKIWLEEDLDNFGSSCPWEEDLSYIKKICKTQNIPIKIISMQKEYYETVVNYLLTEVKAGRTPNPDVMCNNNIKFGLFFKKINETYDKIATGHYAGIKEKDGIYYLKRNPDPIKDQTYFLANLKQEQLKKLTFPLENYTKKEVRLLAEKYNLPNKDRKDSQGICFLGKLKYNDFINHYLGEKEGELIEYETEKVLGKHKGYWFFTIGQRKGIHLGGGPYFVVKKDIKQNKIYISKNYNSEDKKRNTVKVCNLNWFEGQSPKEKHLKVKLRHSDYFYNCEITEETKEKITIKIDKNDQGIAQGQFAAFYTEELCLGSGTICE